MLSTGEHDVVCFRASAANLTRAGDPRLRDRLHRLGPGAMEDVARYNAYRRRGLPCHRCGSPVEDRRIGDLARSVYFCARCQPLISP